MSFGVPHFSIHLANISQSLDTKETPENLNSWPTFAYYIALSKFFSKYIMMLLTEVDAPYFPRIIVWLRGWT